MASWRRYQDKSNYEEAPRRRQWRQQPRTRKPPREIWIPTVPSWEKEFCLKVGSIPWKELLEAKKYLYQSDKVMQWNDSAGEEAFRNAKSRFWAALNGLPCNISITSPDIYIDKIDWNSKIDPELLFPGFDVDSDDEVEEEDENNNVPDNSHLLLEIPIQPTGWDVEVDYQMDKANLLTGLIVGDCGTKDDNVNVVMDNIRDNSRENLRDWNHQTGIALKDCGRNDGNGNSSWECSNLEGNGTLMDKTWEFSQEMPPDLNCLGNGNYTTANDKTWEIYEDGSWNRKQWINNDNNAGKGWETWNAITNGA